MHWFPVSLQLCGYFFDKPLPLNNKLLARCLSCSSHGAVKNEIEPCCGKPKLSKGNSGLYKTLVWKLGSISFLILSLVNDNVVSG